MRTVEEVIELINDAWQWNRFNTDIDDTFSVKIASTVITTTTSAELALVDYRLPALLKVLLIDIGNTSYLHGSWARGTLSLWREDLLKLPDLSGRTRYVHTVNDISALSNSENAPVFWSIHCSNPRTISLEVDGVLEQVPYVHFTHDETVAVPKRWMNEHYPGWENRVITANTLELTGRAWENHVLNKNTALPEVSMADINFDKLAP